MEFGDMPSHEVIEWESFIARSVSNGVVRKEAERIAAEAREAGARLLPAPDSVSAPGGTIIELTDSALRVATANPKVGKWFADRHSSAWLGGEWNADEWSNWLGMEDCEARMPAKLRDGVAILDAPAEQRAILTAERLAIIKQASKVTAG